MLLKISPLTIILGSPLSEMTVGGTSCVRRKQLVLATVSLGNRLFESQPLSVEQMSHSSAFSVVANGRSRIFFSLLA